MIAWACSRAQVAVLVNAIADVLNHYGDRDSAKRIYRHHARRLDALGKCDLDDAASPCCRYCAAKQPCPVDTWDQKVARIMARPRRRRSRQAAQGRLASPRWLPRLDSRR